MRSFKQLTTPFLLVCIITLFATKSELNAQSKYEPGYVITLEKDTIPGFIIYSPQSYNKTSCQFKSLDGEEKEYTPNDLLGYRFTNGGYYNAQIAEGVFLKALVLGKIDLYTDETDFVVVKDGEIFPLLVTKVEFGNDQRKYTQVNQTWQGVLSILMGDCLNDTEELLARTLLQTKSLKRIVHKYNECASQSFGASNEVINADPKVIFEYGASVGFMISAVGNKEDTFVADPAFDPDFASHIDDNTSTSDPTFGFTFNAIFPRFSKTISFLTGLQYTPVTYEFGTRDGTSDFYTEIDQHLLSVPIIIQFRTQERRFGLLFEIGRNQDIFLASNFSHLDFRDGNPEELPSDVFDFDRKRSIVQGGLGIFKTFRQFQAQLIMRYHEGLYQTDYNDLDIRHGRYSVNLIISRQKIIRG